MEQPRKPSYHLRILSILISLCLVLAIGSSCRRIAARIQSSSGTVTSSQKVTSQDSLQGGIAKSSAQIPAETTRSASVDTRSAQNAEEINQSQLLQELDRTLSGMPDLLNDLEEPDDEDLPLP